MNERDDDRRVQALLGSLHEDPPDGGFAARLHLRLSEAGVPEEPSAWTRLFAWLRERPWLVGGLSGAAAGVSAFALAGVVTGVVSGALGGSPTARVAPAPSPVRASVGAADTNSAAVCPPALAASAEVFVVPVGKVAMVQLHFAVERDVDEAEFSVFLPEGLAFFSDGEALPERSFHWSAPLARGDNRVPVAVFGAQPGKHRLAATATIAGEVVVHEIVLDVQGPA